MTTLEAVRERIVPGRSGARIGTFIKTNAAAVVEVIGLTPLHFAVIDAEHAPFDRGDVDLLVLAGRAVGLPVLVRPPDTSASALASALDVGACGLLLPHVDDARIARDVVARTRCRGGTRGFSSSTRAAGFGTLPMAAAVAAVDPCLLIAQIESEQAVAQAGEIAAVEGIDGLLVGRADLALSMGEVDARAVRVMAATRHVLDAALRAGKIAGMAVAHAAERDEFAAWGANWFVVGSDQSLLRHGASQAAGPRA